jgi:iron(III) transport system substrate-binding protein
MKAKPEGHFRRPRDEFGVREAVFRFLWLILPLLGLLAVLIFLLLRPGTTGGKHFEIVVAYCAQDQTYAESIFRDFQNETGINIRAVYDSEAVKTVGLANRLLAERDHPQCDVFWGNEEMRARQLAAQEIFRDAKSLAFFGYRSRCLVYNTRRMGGGSVPHSLAAFTNEFWRGRVAMAYPQFGTTAAHFHALRQHWGDAPWEAWCQAFAANKPLLVDGNSVVVKMVGSGEAWVGLTDSDDIEAGQADGLAVAAAPLFEETLLIPNSVGIIHGAPHPGPAQKLFDYLRQPATAQKLVLARALQGSTTADATTRGLRVDWNVLLRDLDATTEKLSRIFLR